MNPVDPVNGAPGAAPQQDERLRLRKAAEAFESLLLQSLLKTMREAQLEEGFFGSAAGSSTYQAIFEREMSQRLADGSPLGVADMLVEQWEGRAVQAGKIESALRQIENDRGRRLYGIALEAAVAPRPGTPPKAIPGPAEISSPFGWRNDPIDGSRQLHGGIDLPATEGTPVRSIADGRVTAAGPRGAYGLLVEVEHGGGWTTRYAHLSGSEVRPGQWLTRGQPLGTVGSTGRSTGPHLHFETLRNGIRVPPFSAFSGNIRAQVLEP